MLFVLASMFKRLIGLVKASPGSCVWLVFRREMFTGQNSLLTPTSCCWGPRRKQEEKVHSYVDTTPQQSRVCGCITLMGCFLFYETSLHEYWIVGLRNLLRDTRLFADFKHVYVFEVYLGIHGGFIDITK